MNRGAFGLVALALIACGLLLRLGPWRLPLALHHSGGGFLWGALIYAIVAAVRPAAWGTRACLVASVSIVIAIETSRLVHTPMLDAFRLTLAGQLLLGRLFSPLNILVDGLGAATLAWATARSLGTKAVVGSA